jgi:hypothetical protein
MHKADVYAASEDAFIKCSELIGALSVRRIPRQWFVLCVPEKSKTRTEMANKVDLRLWIPFPI